MPALAALLLAAGQARGADEAPLIDNGENASLWRSYSGKPKPEIAASAAGHAGGAIKFTLPESSGPQFVGRSVNADASWDQTQGLSFWLKGDGSDHFIAVSLIDDSYTKRYAALVDLKSTEWRQVKLRWEDFVPEIVSADWMSRKDGNMKPSLVRALWFGRWFYFRPFAASTFEVDDIRLEAKIDPPAAHLPEAPGIPRTLAKLKAKQPVRIVALGDSITYGTHVPQRETNAYPGRLQELLRKKFGYDGVTVVNKGIGGIETRQGIALLTRDLGNPPPDLVTAHFGYNDYSSMLEKRLPAAECATLAGQNLRELVRRVRSLSNGATEVLLIATIPGADEERHTAMDFFGDQAKAVADELKCGFTEGPRAAFREAQKAGKLDENFVRLDDGKLDVAHPNVPGQLRFAEALLKAFE
ncbi:MAG: CIA30 family protein [Planctomycetota bacterium]|nr:CIA30 family protein [Planctomycetota bacterium]